MAGRDHSLVAAAINAPPSAALIATELDEEMFAFDYECSSTSR
jgi:hypothetical protein